MSPSHPMCALEGPGAPLQLGVALNLWLVLLLPLFIRWAALCSSEQQLLLLLPQVGLGLRAPHAGDCDRGPSPGDSESAFAALRRYVHEYRQKLAFIWPHLSSLERLQYVCWDPDELAPMQVPLLCSLGAAFLLGVSTVVGWVWQSTVVAP